MIMNTKKQQTKQVTGVVQDVPPKEYIGLETDTAIVHVDADAKEISVDVLTHNLVDWSGEDANKGYPAPLGHDALVRADMALLGIRDEQNRAEEAEQRLEYLIEKTEEQISIGDGKVLLKVLAESERAISAEEDLQNKIDSIPKVDLTDYAKKDDIPDVSAFIAEIPEEYITEKELEDKGYSTNSDITRLLTEIKFIDGGTSASMLN